MPSERIRLRKANAQSAYWLSSRLESGVPEKKWLAEKQAARDWADVRAYDADDLEHWLEECPAVALQFAEELGITGPGVESITRYWETWSKQSDPPIPTEAFFTDREVPRKGDG